MENICAISSNTAQNQRIIRVRPKVTLTFWKGYVKTLLDAVVECLIEKGVLTPPADGIGAEGCWMSVEK